MSNNLSREGHRERLRSSYIKSGIYKAKKQIRKWILTAMNTLAHRKRQKWQEVL